MKKIIKKINFLKVLEVALALTLSTAPLAASALSLPGCNSFIGIRCDGNNSVTGLILIVINWMLALAGLVAVLFLIIGGFWFITSAGNEETAEKGKSTVINAIIGIVVIVLSYVIVTVISNLVSNPNTVSAP